MKKQRKVNNKKLKILVLKAIFLSNRKSRNVNLLWLAQEVSKKQIVTSFEVQEILEEMAKDNMIEFLANSPQKSYNYIVKLKLKGEYFLKQEQNKGSDFFVGVFVYILMIALGVLFVFIIRNLFIN